MSITHDVSQIMIPATMVGLLLLASTVQAQLQFEELAKSHLPPDSDATQAMALGDVDGDGDLDLVLGNQGQNRLYLNDGTGAFTDVTAARMPYGSSAVSERKPYFVSEYYNSVALGDVDLDGDLDIVFLNQLCLNDGAGTFTDATAGHLPASYGSYGSSVALGDVDGDGDLDALLGRQGTSGYDVYWDPLYTEEWYWESPAPNLLYLNDGTGVFVEAPAGQLPIDSDWTSSVALGDVDGDGDLDAVIGNDVWTWSAGRVTWGSAHYPGPWEFEYQYGPNRLYLNDGAGVFTDASGQLPSDPGWATAVVLEDVDLDGDLDVVFLSSGAAQLGVPGEGLKLSLNDGRGTFADATAARLPPGVDSDAISVAFGDVDLDGTPDLVVGRDGQNRLHLNDGTGRFADATAARMPIDDDFTETVALGDVDGDGDPDLILGDTLGQQNRLYLNLLCQLDVPFPVRLGQPYQLDVYARYGPTGTVNTAVSFISTGTASIPVPPLGTFALDPAQMIRLPAFIIPQPDGLGSLSFVVPNLPGLVGASVYAQAVIVQYPVLHGLTNWTADVIVQ